MQEGTYLEVLREVQASDQTDPRNVATCDACGFSWDDSMVTSLTPAPGGRCPNEYNHEASGPEGFYVTVKSGSRTGYLLGPFGSKAEAEGNVDRGQRLARQVNDGADFYAYGVTRVVMQPGRELPKGKLNDVELVTS